MDEFFKFMVIAYICASGYFVGELFDRTNQLATDMILVKEHLDMEKPYIVPKHKAKIYFKEKSI